MSTFCPTFIGSTERNTSKTQVMKKKINCISVHGIVHEMYLLESDCPGYYLYRLIPTELGYEPKIMYIAPDRADHWMYGKPMEGKQISHTNIFYCHIYV
jgi:hypothetical protein